jgi:hypothetical protein
MHHVGAVERRRTSAFKLRRSNPRRIYHINFKPNCMRRAVTRVLVMAPNVGLCVLVLALPNCV